ncbi:MAG: hypothetical protein KC944_11125 [Candidatus Omnitrophica bacterium]|nr:hypothetical protein [Candidatus Omnitrophota bacterium]
MRGTHSIFIWFALVLPVSDNACSFSGEGEGSQASPYVIANATQLQEMNLDLTAHYVVGNDIDASGVAAWNEGKGFEPIGSASASFTGTLDGLGHRIGNLTIVRPSEHRVGVFRFIRGARIANMVLEDVEAIGSEFVGAIAGIADYSVVSDCIVHGEIAGDRIVGGLIGGSEGETTLVGNRSECTVLGGDRVGGMVGHKSSGNISLCQSVCVVSGSDTIGGLIGLNSGGAVENSFSESQVSGVDNVGGLIGGNYSLGESAPSQAEKNGLDDGDHVQKSGAKSALPPNVLDCHATGSVSGEGNVGGLVGVHGSGVGGLTTTIKNCYSTGEVLGRQSAVGGLVGKTLGGHILDSSATGEVSSPGNRVGGLVGENNCNSVKRSYASGRVSGSDEVGGLIGRHEGMTLTTSFSSSDVAGRSAIGGLVGYRFQGGLTNCYGSGSAAGGSLVGGLIGHNYAPEVETGGIVRNCYSTTLVSGGFSVGGFAGMNSAGGFSSCYWDMETSSTSTGVGNQTPAGVIGETTDRMYRVETYANWDFDNVWWIHEDNDYPRFYGLPDFPPTPTPTITPTPSDTPTPTQTPTPRPTLNNALSDINEDGAVNPEDLIIVLKDLGKTAEP